MSTMNSTRSTQDEELGSEIFRVVLIFLTAVVLAGLALIVFNEFLSGMVI